MDGEKIENIDQTKLDFALIMSEMDSPLNSALQKWYMGLHITKLQFSPNMSAKHASQLEYCLK